MSQDTTIKFLPEGGKGNWDDWPEDKERVRAVVDLVDFKGEPAINVYNNQVGIVTVLTFEAPTWRVGVPFKMLRRLDAPDLAGHLQGLIDAEIEGGG